jgi:ferredoxin
MVIHVDPTRCCASGLCATAVPEVFDQHQDGTVLLLDPNPPDLTDAHRAADNCPVGAIMIEDRPVQPSPSTAPTNRA